MGILDSLSKMFSQPGSDPVTDEREAICPNCTSKLSKVPGAKTKCKQCGKYIYVRTTPKNERVVATKIEAESIDKEWAKINGTDFTPIVEVESYSETKEKIKKQFGKEPSKSDVKWRRFNQKLERQMKQNDIYGLSSTYYEMAAFVEREGKDPSEFRELGYKHRLKASANMDQFAEWAREDYIKGVEVLTAEDSCESCKVLNNTQYTISEAKNNKPIPVKDCTHRYGCRCTYLPVIE